ncbi:hypothetical protein [Tropicibacter sp. S64]|uniref:hypothetical protein n=1 Tax=Tropicibacter sp. S64 TaxID=3415122 RepID=UPI003C7A7FAB
MAYEARDPYVTKPRPSVSVNPDHRDPVHDRVPPARRGMGSVIGLAAAIFAILALIVIAFFGTTEQVDPARVQDPAASAPMSAPADDAAPPAPVEQTAPATGGEISPAEPAPAPAPAQ